MHIDTAEPGIAAGSGVLVPVFAATIFSSAFLLFAVEPMFAKMVLPRFGGSASVWSVALVFFQSALLAGYAFAGRLARMPRLAHVVAIQTMVCLAAALTLPIALPAEWAPQAGGFTELRLVAVLAAAVGLPFFALSVNGPLLQAWFARTKDARAGDPYFLYAASNLGSFAALIAYPTLIEPWFGVVAQTRAWAIGFLVLVAMILAAGGLAMRHAAPVAAAVATTPHAPIAVSRRLRWTFLAFVPSALLVAITQHLSTDVAAAPFLWVLPLALFLASFVVVFARRPPISAARVARLHPWLLALVVAATLVPGLPLAARVLIDLAAFFVVGLLAHGALAADRPAAEDLGGFYLWMSLGGVLGGIFAGLLAPAIFSDLWEYPLLLAASALCRPGAADPGRRAALAGLLTVTALVGLFALPGLLGRSVGDLPLATYLAAVGVVVVTVAAARDAPCRLAACVAVALLGAASLAPGLGRSESLRGFYGVNRIAETADGRFRLLFSGTTIHGAERIRDDDGRPVAGPPRPATYYWDGAPLVRAVETARRLAADRPMHLLAVGLGTGSLACRAEPGESWTFLEIDPDVVRIARDRARFRFLADCAPQAEVRIGDGRLLLAAATGAKTDAIVVDAFASDSIPVHLLTREALRTWADRLAPDGIVAFHLQNRHMELTRVAAAAAEAEGFVAHLGRGRPDAARRAEFEFETTVVVLSRGGAATAALDADPAFARMAPERALAAWTDDHADVLGAILRRWREDEPQTLAK